MADILAVIIEACCMVIEVILRVVWFVVESMARFVLGEPLADESPHSTRRVLIAIAPLAFIALLIGGPIFFFYWHANVTQARTNATRTVVGAEVVRLSQQVDKHGNLIKHPKATLDMDDAWGNPLQVKYRYTLSQQVVTVRSAGADGRTNTPDDVTAMRRVPLPKKTLAKNLIGGAARAVKKHVTGKK